MVFAKFRGLRLSSVFVLFLLIASSALSTFSGCDDSEQILDSVNSLPYDTIFIVDRLDKKWEITFGVEEMGMDSSHFLGGMGQYRIPPINDPRFITSEDPAFPVSSPYRKVIGLLMDGEIRSYGLEILVGNEMVNDYIGEAPIAVAY